VVSRRFALIACESVDDMYPQEAPTHASAATLTSAVLLCARWRCPLLQLSWAFVHVSVPDGEAVFPVPIPPDAAYPLASTPARTGDGSQAGEWLRTVPGQFVHYCQGVAPPAAATLRVSRVVDPHFVQSNRIAPQCHVMLDVAPEAVVPAAAPLQLTGTLAFHRNPPRVALAQLALPLSYRMQASGCPLAIVQPVLAMKR
jgi:hypothetical protein